MFLGEPATSVEDSGNGDDMKERTKIESNVNGRGEQAPKTLRELGVPGALATELEAAFRLLGKTKGDRITGYTFVAPDGARHTLRIEGAAAELAPDRAA
jgi:hypothetical protein